MKMIYKGKSKVRKGKEKVENVYVRKDKNKKERETSKVLNI
jgi:hypothetical protein